MNQVKTLRDVVVVQINDRSRQAAHEEGTKASEQTDPHCQLEKKGMQTEHDKQDFNGQI